MLGEFIQEKEVLSMAKKDWPEYINICIIYRIVTLFFSTVVYVAMSVFYEDKTGYKFVVIGMLASCLDL